MTRTYTRLTPKDQKALAEADWSTPWPTARALGARLGRDPRVLLIWAQNRGLAPRGRKRLVTEDDVQAIREGVAAGLLGPSIARTLGLSVETVRRVMNREGIARAREHEWTESDGDPPVDRCARCGTRRNWPGALQSCVRAGLALLALFLLGCPSEEPGPQAPPVWTPLVCDVPEVVVWDIGGVRTTRRTVVALLPAPPEDVLIRVLTPERSPCPEDAGCTVVHDTALAPDGRWRYHGPGSDVVTGLEDGTTRVLCSVTIGRTVQVFARDGEYLVRGTR